MKDVKLMRSARLKKESRDITKQILDFGVKEEQKLDIIFKKNDYLNFYSTNFINQLGSQLQNDYESIKKSIPNCR